MNATMVLLSLFSPLLIALLRRRRMSSDVVDFLSVVIVVVIYTLGRYLDGALTWPPSNDFWLGLAALFGLQQGAYRFVWKDKPVTRALTRLGDGSDA